jgi:hypothetical protein
MKVSGQFQAPTDIPWRKFDGTHSVGNWVGLGVGRYLVKKILKKNISCPIRKSNLELQACILIKLLTGIPARSVISIMYKKVFHPVLVAKNSITKITLTYFKSFTGCKYVFNRSSPTAEGALIFLNSHASPACPSGKSNL